MWIGQLCLKDPRGQQQQTEARFPKVKDVTRATQATAFMGSGDRSEASLSDALTSYPLLEQGLEDSLMAGSPTYINDSRLTSYFYCLLVSVLLFSRFCSDVEEHYYYGIEHKQPQGTTY